MTELVTNDGTRLAYTDWGKGKPVVFAHAWALRSEQWNFVLPGLVGAGLRCITYDRRGHGRSDVPGHGYDYDTLADDLARLIEVLELDDVVLVGHSFGCGEIVRYLTRHGKARVERIVLIAPIMPFLPRTPDNPDGIPVEVLTASATALAHDVAQWCDDNGAGFFGRAEVSDGMRDWVTRQIVDTPLMVLLETMKSYATDFRAELAEVGVPALVLHGDLDASAPIEITGRKVADLIPRCRLEIYEGSGHGLYASEHERVTGDVLSFMSEASRQRL